MDINKEKSLIDCLKWCNVASLPEPDDKENIWIKAIALVKKRDGSENYVAMQKDDKLNDKIVKDFGSVSLIHEVVEIYPYYFLSAAYMPEFKTKKKEERIEFLRKFDRDLALDDLSLKELNKLVAVAAIKTQIKKESNKE